MTERTTPAHAASGLAYSLAGGSLALGVAAFLWPEAVARRMGKAVLAGRPAGTSYYRLLGLRDILIGVGLAAGVRHRRPTFWLVARAASDLVDAFTIGLPATKTRRALPIVTGLVLPLASGATALGLSWLLGRSIPLRADAGAGTARRRPGRPAGSWPSTV